VLKPIAYVWHQNLFISAARVQTRRNLCLSLGGKILLTFPSRSFAFGDFHRTKNKIQPSSMQQLDKLSYYASRWAREMEYQHFRKCASLHRGHISRVHSHWMYLGFSWEPQIL